MDVLDVVTGPFDPTDDSSFGPQYTAHEFERFGDLPIQVPLVTTTQINTTVTIPDQGTVLLGGQRVMDELEVESGVPVLSKIPILSRFFSNRLESKEEKTLLVLLKPTILIQNEEEERNYPGLLDQLGG